MIIEDKRDIINRIYWTKNLTAAEYYGTEDVSEYAADCFEEIINRDLDLLYWEYNYVRRIYY